MSTARSAARVALLPTPKSKPDYRVGGTLLAIVFILILHKFLGALSYNFFIVTDNILKLNDGVPPFIMWALMGTLFGAAMGSVIVSRKYKLPAKWMFIPSAIFIAIIAVLCAISGPLANNIVQTFYKDINGARFAEVTASRWVPDYQGFHYDAGNLTDTDESTAWMYLENEGQPASISYVFNADSMQKVSDVKLVSLMIYAGYAKTYTKWKSSGKPRGYQIFKNGEEIAKGNFAGNYGYEAIPVEPTSLSFGDTVRIRMLSSYNPLNKKVNLVSVSGMYPVINFTETR